MSLQYCVTASNCIANFNSNAQLKPALLNMMVCSLERVAFALRVTVLLYNFVYIYLIHRYWLPVDGYVQSSLQYCLTLPG